uniref:Uncharacterized protein n=1 Tax=Arundo donax TaxID=35708 RepID=A0A0A9GSQ3_ARUDO
MNGWKQQHKKKRENSFCSQIYHFFVIMKPRCRHLKEHG